MQKLIKFKISLLFIVVLTLSLFGCSDDLYIFGTITYDGEAGDAYYVILDDDTDETNGYVKRQIINPDAAVSSVDYSINTADVPAGSYYLLFGYDDSNNPANMDPNDSSVWEAKAWYGGSSSLPVEAPASANITDLNKQYDISLIGLP